MKKLIIAVMVLTSLPSFATEFKVVCAGSSGSLNYNDVARAVAVKLNSQIKELGESVIDVSAPQTSSASSAADTAVSSCVTVKLK